MFGAIGMPYHGRNIDSFFAVLGWSLTASSHGEVLIDRIEAVFGVSLGDNTEELNVIQDLVVEGKVIAGDDIDACIFLELPVGESESLALLEEIFLGDFVTPIGFSGFLEVSVHSHTRETQN